METSKIRLGRLIGWLVFSMCLAGVLGNLLYPFLLEITSPSGAGALVALSPNEPFTHRALAVLFFALLGAAVVVSTALYSRFSPRRSPWPALVACLSTGAGVVVLGLVVVSRQLASAAGVTLGADVFDVSLPISAIPLPFVAAVAGVAVLLVGCALSLSARRKHAVS